MKVAELRFSAFVAQMGMNFSQGEKVLKFFKTVGQDRTFLWGMRMSRAKISKVVKNVSSPYQKKKAREKFTKIAHR